MFSDAFQVRLAETIAWCNRRVSIADPETCLRSRVLQPHVVADTYRYGLLSEGISVVPKLAEKRNYLLRSEGNYPSVPLPPLPHLAGGRLLAYQPDASFKDALACSETLGFIDALDAPPWDTWILYVPDGYVSHLPPTVAAKGVVISWIPPLFHDLAQKGIDAQPYGALAWVEDMEVPLIPLLQLKR